MKKLNIILLSLFSLSLLSTSCSMFGLDMQEDYDYVASTLDPHINKTARQYLEERGKNPLVANDTIFKWMQLGLEYAEIDLSEYEKPGRTYVFLSNNAIRVLPTRTASGVVITTSNVPTAGMWFTFAVTAKNADGSLKLKTDGTPDVLPCKNWSDYPKEDVKNYFLSLIVQSDYGFSNGQIANTTLSTLLPAGASATDKTLLGYFAAGTEPNNNAAGDRILTRHNTRLPGTIYGFDPESKVNFRVVSSDYSPLRHNDFTNAATAGIIATNGQIHVFSTVVYPWRY